MKIYLPDSGFSVRPSKILCIGQNYAKHIVELNSEMPTEPVIFLKPPSTLLPDGTLLELPSFSQNVHHEAELVLVIGKDGSHIPKERALEYVAGYAIGLDLTARDVQNAAKSKGLPWTVAKGFDGAAPLSEIIPASAVQNVQNLQIQLRVNDAVRQDGNSLDMIFDVATLISYISTIFSLETGDLIFTGTPEGVSKLNNGDILALSLLENGAELLNAKWEVA